MPTHTYSIVLYDLTWQDIGAALDTVSSVDNITGLNIYATYDTSGGTQDDGTEYDTEARFTARYDYSLGNGDTSLDSMANALSQVTTLPDKETIKDKIKSRG